MHVCSIIQDPKSKVPWTSQLISHSKQQEIPDPSGLFTLISNGFAATNNTILNPAWLSWVSGLYNCDQAKCHSYQFAQIAGLGWQCNSLINSQRHDLFEDTKDIGNRHRHPFPAQKCESCERWWYHFTVIPNPILVVPIHDLANVCGSYKRNHGWSTLQLRVLDHQPRDQSVPTTSFVPKWNSLIKKNNE